MKRQGFTLVEMVVATGLMMLILLAGSMVFLAAQSIWSLTYTQIQLQDNLRQGLQRISAELQESGRDANGVLQVTVNDNAGLNGTDILKFAVPLCVCGTSAITSAGSVKSWGAPLTWGKTGCDGKYTLNANGKVDICHLPPGNPNNTQNLSVNVSSVKAHLAHGDWLGPCNSCNPVNYNNKFVQYKTNAAGQLIREVLDAANGVVASVVVADDISNFQTNFIVGKDSLTLSITVVKKAVPNRIVTVTGTIDVILRNGS
jgi:hypothetical protein